MRIYIFALAGSDKSQNNILEKCIEYIGSKQSGLWIKQRKRQTFF